MLRTLALTFLLVTLAGSFSPVSREAAAAQETEDVDRYDGSRGAALFSRFCQRCHEPRGPAERTDRQWVMIMQHMEMRGNMTTERAAQVRAFLLASNGPARSPGRLRSDLAMAPDPESIGLETFDEGRRIYRGSGGCAGCHGQALDGGVIAPSLRNDEWQNGDEILPYLLEIIRNGVQGSSMAAYPGGISDEMAVTVASYVWAVNQDKIAP